MGECRFPVRELADAYLSQVILFLIYAAGATHNVILFYNLPVLVFVQKNRVSPVKLLTNPKENAILFTL